MQERDYVHGFRFGFGGEAGFNARSELSPGSSLSMGATLMKQRFELFADVRQRVKASGRNPAVMEEEKALSAVAQNRDVHEAIVQSVTGTAMFTERLALFWSNHFCLGTGNATVARLAGPHVAILRDKMFGRFRDLLEAAVLSPAMMQYLNLQQAIGPNSAAAKKNKQGLNENLGREILELHSLGVNGGYSQDDVGALSRLLTGWRYVAVSGEVGFVARLAEPGAKYLLGHSIGGDKPLAKDLQAALDVLAEHPATAQFIARKLVMHFLGPGFDHITARIAGVFSQSGGELRTVYAALIDAADKTPTTRIQFRNDAVFLISALRALPLRDGVLNFEMRENGRPKSNPATTGAIGQLRQKFWLAPSPAGWPDAPEYWMAPSVMTARLRLIPRLVRLTKAEEPAAWSERILGPLLRPATRTAIGLAPNRLQGMGLVLASPEFNRR